MLTRWASSTHKVSIGCIGKANARDAFRTPQCESRMVQKGRKIRAATYIYLLRDDDIVRAKLSKTSTFGANL